ncbi:MAG: S8 family serine peptidase, partial [Kofleriaceae bacterium]
LDVALSVSAVDAAGQLAPFASRGPRIDDGAIKPDLTALGVDVVGARASGIDPIGAPVGTAYQTLSGTTFAAPRAAGAAALLYEQHPAWTAAQIKAALTGAADPSPALSAFEQGSGQLDIARATRQTVVAAPSNLSLGLARWPHHDDPLIERAVTYRNTGATPIHLALAVTLRDPARQPALAGMARVSPTTLDILAGGSADAVVTIDPNGDAPDGQYEGALIATGDDIRIVTPVGVAREVESYDLTIRVSDADGQPISAPALLIGRTQLTLEFLDLDGELALRRPREQYTLLALLDNTLLSYPRLELDHDVTADLDGTRAQPIALKVPGIDPVLRSQEMMYVDVALRFAVKLQNVEQLFSANFGPELDAVRSLAAVSTLDPFDQTQPDTVYLLAHGERGHMMTGWSEVIEPRQLARVDVHTLGHGVSSWRAWAAVVFDDAPELGPLIGNLGFADYPGAFDRTEYYYGPGFRFDPLVFEQAATFIDDPLNVGQEMRAKRYLPGSRSRETWHQAPFGPAFATLDGNPAAQRIGDVLRVTPSMLSDQGVPARSTFTLQAHDRNALFRDGELIVEHVDFLEDFFPPVTVPPGPATYRFERSMSRSEITRFTGEPLFELSPEVSAAWTFRSAHVDGSALLALPTLRFSPALDDDNRSAARLLVLPFRVERPDGAPRPAITDVHLEASFDDGAHWAPLPVARFDDQGVAIVLHPRHAAFVSLRGSATDVAGNHVDQTILHAYGLAR